MQLAKSLVTAVVAFVVGVLFGVLGMATAWVPFRGHATFAAFKAISQLPAMGLHCALIAVLTVGVSFALRTAAGSVAAGEPCPSSSAPPRRAGRFAARVAPRPVISAGGGAGSGTWAAAWGRCPG